MAANGEVFAWPEAYLYAYASGAGTGVALAYAENVAGAVDWDWLKFKNQNTGAWADRTKFVLADKNATVSFGQLFYDNGIFQSANSASAMNFDVVFSAAGGMPNSAAYRVWSAVWTHFGFQGQQGDIFRAAATLRAADISALY